MSTRDQWKSYTEAVSQIARSTIRAWMVGIEVEDIKQELWCEFFKVCNEEPEIGRGDMIERLKTFAAGYKRTEREQVFGKQSIMLDDLQLSQYEKHWREVKQAFDVFLKSLPTEDAMILRYAAQGCTNAKIAHAMGISIDSIKKRRPSLIRSFQKEVENNVQIDFGKRNSGTDEER